jgi:hypothetical protein
MKKPKNLGKNITACLNKDRLLDFWTKHWEIIVGLIAGYFIAKLVSKLFK